jgi:hypothetical protein
LFVPIPFAAACRRPYFCLGKSKQNQRDAKLAIHGSNSCTTASLQKQQLSSTPRRPLPTIF